MKKIILCLTVLLALPVCAQEQISKTEAYKALAESNAYQHQVCSNIIDNFRKDNQFSTYMKNRCILFEADRQRQSSIVFPYPNHREEGYNANYPIIMSAYIIKMNKQEVDNYKTIVTEYCKHNAYKFEKKSPQSCTQETIDSLF